MVDRTVVANDWADLVDGNLATSTDKTESRGSTAAAWGYAWTGTDNTGAHYANNDRTGWTITSGANGRCGKASLSTEMVGHRKAMCTDAKGHVSATN